MIGCDNDMDYADSETYNIYQVRGEQPTEKEEVELLLNMLVHYDSYLWQTFFSSRVIKAIPIVEGHYYFA